MVLLKMSFKSSVIFLIITLTASIFVLGHEGHDGAEVVNSIPQEELFKRVEVVNDNYLRSVKPIFSKKCFDCHSNQTQYPWYHSFPVIGVMLDKDISEAKKHLDMSDDFPFEGHGSVQKDLKAIGDTVNKNSMPPFKYWIMHPRSRLTDDEKKIVNNWIDESLKKLGSNE